MSATVNRTTLGAVAEMLPTLLHAKLVPFIRSSPAIGKSSIVQQCADQFKLKVIDVRLAECDPTDIVGLPYFNQERMKAAHYPFETFPTEGDAIPEGYNGWLLFLDELSNAAPSVQGACYKLVLDRRVGQHKLHEAVHIIAAGNLETDGALAQPMSSALVSRFAMYEVNVNHDEWMAWATGTDMDYRITSYLNFRPEHLYTFAAETCEQPYAAPRTWSMLNQVLRIMAKKSNQIDIKHVALFGGIVGQGVASEFINYIKLEAEMPTFDEIMKSPDKAKLPNNLGTRWAIMGMVAYRVDDTTLAKAIEYIERFTSDLQMVSMREIRQRHPELKEHSNMKEWILRLSKVFV